MKLVLNPFTNNLDFTDGIPSLVTGKFLTNNGSVLSWGTVTIPPSVTFGTTTLIPYTNVAGTDFLYSTGLAFDGYTETASNFATGAATVGAEKITNGTFTGATTGWTLGGTNIWNWGHVITVSGVSTTPTAGAVYRNNPDDTLRFTVRYALLTGSIPNKTGIIYLSSTAGTYPLVAPATFVKVSGTGDTNLTYSVRNTDLVFKNGSTGTLSQTSAAMVTPLVIGENYSLSFVLTAAASTSVVPTCGGITFPTVIVSGTYTYTFKPTSTADLVFTPTAASRFYIDTISLTKTDGNVSGTGNVIFTGTVGVGAPTPIYGTGSRMMWIPSKAAFRAGYDSAGGWNDDNIGNYSIAGGSTNIAKGNYSNAFGNSNKVYAVSGTAFGSSNTLNTEPINGGAVYGFAVGISNIIGDGVTSGGGNTGIGLGQQNYIYGFGGCVGIGIGNNLSVTANGSVAIGQGNTLNGLAQYGVGNGSILGVDAAAAVFLGNATITGVGGASVGATNQIDSSYGLVVGNVCTIGVGADYAVSIGSYNVNSTSEKTITLGSYLTASGLSAICIGTNAGTIGEMEASGYGSIVLGYNISGGATVKATNDFSFAGGGTIEEGSTLLSSGAGSFVYGFAGNADTSTAGTLSASGTLGVAIGWNVISEGDYNFCYGHSFTESTASSFNLGWGQLDYQFYSGGLRLIGDTKSLFFGASDDASIVYNGTNLVINPKLVGTGVLSILGDISLLDEDIVLGTTTGTKIGTATNQKLSFFNATPIIQPIATTEIGLVLSNLGLRAAGTAYPITTSGSVTLGSLTNTCVVFSGASGLLTDSVNFTYDGTNLNLFDNITARFGTGGDATIKYNGTNWIFNPRAVGTGALQILNNGTVVNTEFTTASGFAIMILRKGLLTSNSTTVYPTNTSMFQMITNGTAGLRTAAYSDTPTLGSFFQFNKWRGTDAAPTPALSGDAVFRITGGAGYSTGAANTSLLTAQFKMILDGDAKVYGGRWQAPIAITFESNHLTTTAASAYVERGRLTSCGNWGFGTATPTYKVDIKGYDDTTTIKTVAGQALVDLTIGGTYTGSYNSYVIEIDAGDDESADPNTFKWSDDDGATYTEGVAITGLAQTLSSGLTVTFDATTGYILTEQWLVKRVLANPLNVQTSAGVSVVSVLDTGNFVTNGGVRGKITTVTDTYQILVTDETVICDKTTAFTCTLPTGVVGQVFEVSNINTGTVTLDGAGTDTISGASDIMLGQWDSVKVRYYIANKWVIQ